MFVLWDVAMALRAAGLRPPTSRLAPLATRTYIFISKSGLIVPKRTYIVDNAPKRYRTVTGYSRKAGGMTKYSRAGRKSVSLAALVKASKGELKGVDTKLDVSPVLATTNTNGSAFCLNVVNEGAGGYNRVGRKINGKSLRVRCSAFHSMAPVATTTDRIGNQLRMVVVWDKQPNGGAIPAFDTVFGQTDLDGVLASTFLDPVNYSQVDRFTVLRDCNVLMPVTAAPSGGTTNSVINFYQIDEFIDLKNKETIFNEVNGGTVADVQTGTILVYFRAQLNTATNIVSIDPDAFSRYRYTDK